MLNTLDLILVLYLVLINGYGYVMMAVDKQRAIHRNWRISERHLWLSAGLGGVLGVFIGMKVCHHKTRHLSFRIGVPLLILFHLLLWGGLFFEIGK
ncbi:uncharacterized membrane protein YsdA (DUF1294 family) [Pullulanibacillus pueri]|uniref:DUF1294 domain-containing protein n=1 Tax=Pullulanibacillus pueri TaxID=1437324 RepID=A0A8J3ERH1_9BACL|nr:DUF1294 domain-containing protein [Pullulanibacillus pueri]MBM7682032.1 uncharacterized membrane protein YsdA (DUF1294 family) [Pullulanibacillus pueri]GGH88279.1 hypothetical protein GCM10007096_40250 [Pullulanibacillus pueri]